MSMQIVLVVLSLGFITNELGPIYYFSVGYQ